MKRILTNRWFLAGLGLLALSLLIWFVGDAIAVFDRRPLGSPWVRGILIAVILLGWAGWEVWQVIRARKANETMLEQMAGTVEDPSEARSREEVAQLKGRFEEAVGTLKKARFKDKTGAQAYLYQLPWYVFIGAPGSGKTTALTRSGLRFLLADASKAGALKGVGGTRNCDWWFTDEAVFLDTAGRYTTQDSNQKVDSAAWIGFLELLRKFRPRSPLNGAIVTVSISDLLSQSEQERVEYAATVRQRVGELYEKLGVRFPVYIMVTKCDLVAGFTEMFTDLGQDERGQVWGITFPYKLASSEGFNFASGFSTGFGNLEKRLNSRLVDRLQTERDPQRRSAIFGFPQQFSLLAPLVTHFLDNAFGSNRFNVQPLVRGVYFTSGTQEGTPLDRVLGTLSRTLGLERRVIPPLASSGKSFFLTRLLRDVVFPEGGLAGFNEKKQKRAKWLLYGGFGTLALVSVLLMAFWGLSYVNNKSLIAQTQTRLASLQDKASKLPQAKADDLPVVMDALFEARTMPYGYAEQKKGASLTFRMGLFQGDKLGEQAIMAYRRLLRDALLARIVLRLEDQLQHSDSNPQLLYEALKSYLMLYDDKHMDAEALQLWVVADWGPRLPRLGENRNAANELADHVRAALERRPLELSVPMDKELVTNVRRKLASSSLPDRIYTRLKIMGVGEGVPAFNLAEAAGPNAIQVLVRASGEPLSAPFPGLFTKDGYAKGFKGQAEKIAAQMAAEEKWVLGEFAGSASLLSLDKVFDQVKGRYLEDYARQWNAFLADIRLKPSQSLSDTILYARVLSGADSPLRKLVSAVSRETTLQEKKGAVGQAADATKEAAKTSVLNAATNVVGRILGTAPTAIVDQGGVAPEARVDQQFEGLRQMAGAGGQPGQIDGLISKLADFYQELTAMENTLKGGNAQVQGIQSAVKLQAEIDRLPVPLAGIVKSLIQASSGQASAAAQATMQAGVQGASAFCDKAVKGRYPFSRSGQADVTVEDFGAVFGPNGDLDNYFKANLAAIVDVSGSTWRVKPGGVGAATVTGDTLRQFQNADAIRRAFFRGGQAGASADLALVSSEAGPVTLDYDGEVQKLNPGQGAIRVKWPAQKPGAVAKLYGASPASAVTGEGGWAVFRLFDKAAKDAGGASERVRLNYTLDGKKVVLELRATSVLNPFRLKELETFQCPGRK